MNGIVAALIGRLPKDADGIKYTGTGNAFLGFSVAVEDSKRGEGDPTEWVRVTCWGETAEQLDGRLVKGTSVYCEGRLKLAEWDGANGQRRSGLNLSAWTVQPLGQIGRRAPKPGAGNGGVAPASTSQDVPARRSPGGGPWATARPATMADRSHLV